MVGAALQYQRGAITKEDVVNMLEKPETKPHFKRELARPEGLTMLSCKYKEGIISDTPIEIPEDKFCRCQKAKAAAAGVEYKIESENQETIMEGFADMFDSD